MSNNADSEQLKNTPLDPDPSSERNALPPVVPPKTAAPSTFNQQVNIQQIPPKVWDKLSAEQIVDMTKTILGADQRMDERYFSLALEQAKQAGASARTSMIIGAALAVMGIAATTYLAASGGTVIAAILGTSLVTLVSVVLGRQMRG
jgi:hypothetical protein